MGGTPKRMENFAHFIMDEIGYKLPAGTQLQDISAFSYRYSMYKVSSTFLINLNSISDYPSPLCFRFRWTLKRMTSFGRKSQHTRKPFRSLILRGWNFNSIERNIHFAASIQGGWECEEALWKWAQSSATRRHENASEANSAFHSTARTRNNNERNIVMSFSRSPNVIHLEEIELLMFSPHFVLFVSKLNFRRLLTSFALTCATFSL